jgi:hypothetical protein
MKNMATLVLKFILSFQDESSALFLPFSSIVLPPSQKGEFSQQRR